MASSYSMQFHFQSKCYFKSILCLVETVARSDSYFAIEPTSSNGERNLVLVSSITRSVLKY